MNATPHQTNPPGMTHIIRSVVLPILAFSFMIESLHAGSATWNSNPTNGDWNTAANWTPATVPDGPNDTATFATSAQTAVSLSQGVSVSAIEFSSGASAYTISYINTLIFEGGGIVNNSGTVQNIVPFSDGINAPLTFFYNSSSAGNSTVFTNSGSLNFNDTSTAGSATIISKGTSNAASGGSTNFFGLSSAGDGIFLVGGAEASGGNGGTLVFNDSSNAGNGTFTVGGNIVSNGGSGILSFNGNSSALNGNFTVNGNQFGGGSPAFVVFFGSSTSPAASITINGGTASGALGGLAEFGDTASAGNATIVANGGSGGGLGGVIEFFGNATGGTSQMSVFGNGNLDISIHNVPGVTIGSIEGNGQAFLGGINLTVGSNNQSKTFSGVIQDGGIIGGTGGSLTKIGSGKLTLSNANTYTGGTIVKTGTLLVANKTGSATGTGSVQVKSGTLGGIGIVAGSVTLGTGSSSGAVILPGKNASSPGALTINSALTFNSLSTYKCALNRTTPVASEIVALGVTINSNASFTFLDRGGATLTTGTVLTVINNNSASPIFGTFSNLADGSVFGSHGNNFQANYEGGDGNDLTLTVVP
jgi:autotransporter-associated beta strand protein